VATAGYQVVAVGALFPITPAAGTETERATDGAVGVRVADVDMQLLLRVDGSGLSNSYVSRAMRVRAAASRDGLPSPSRVAP
jgi:hypothetical protein